MQPLLTFGSYTMTNRFMNGAGFCKDAEMVRLLAESSVGAVVFGSVTDQHRAGNAGQRLTYYGEHEFSLNSIGLKNEGGANYASRLPAMIRLVHEHGKPFILSGAGFSPEDYFFVSMLAREVEVDGLELNLGCPNAIDNGQRHRIAGFDPELVELIMDEVEEALSGHDVTITVGVKMPPFSDPYQLAEVADVLKSCTCCGFVTTSNTFPNAQDFADDGSYLIDVKDGYAGYAGNGFFPIALGQVQQWVQALEGHCPVIGVGGVTNASRVTYHLHAGASAVQATSALYFQEGERSLRTKIEELAGHQEPEEYFAR